MGDIVTLQLKVTFPALNGLERERLRVAPGRAGVMAGAVEVRLPLLPIAMVSEVTYGTCT